MAFYSGRLSAFPYCAVDFRTCAIAECGKVFAAQPKLRRKYCSDLCSGKAIIARPSNKISSIPQAMRHLDRDRRSRSQRRAWQASDRHVVPTPAPEPWKRPVENTHVPGSIAFMLLYGDSKPTFSRGTEPARIGRGGGRSAVQVGGPNL